MSAALTPEQIRTREDRHWNERMRYGLQTPAGPWDDDLDKWQSPAYIFSLDGERKDYKVIVNRSPWLSWNVYVEVPKGHIAAAVTHYDFFNENRDGMMPAPFKLTYGGWRATPLPITYKPTGVLFGFDHTWQGRDLMPRWTKPQSPAAVFTTREMAKAEGERLLDYFIDVGKERVSNILRYDALDFCDQCFLFHKETTLVEGKHCCEDCVPVARKEAVEARIAAADAGNWKKQEAERKVAVASAGAVAAKGDAANASAIYAAMMAKKKGKKGGTKGGR
jgi:hypothetical protein